MKRQIRLCFAAALVAVLVVGMLPVEADTHAFMENGSVLEVEYPRGYTHRPFIAFYTSLSCPPCMSSAEPAHTSYWESNGYEEGQPVTTVVFHLRAGGAGDDILYHEEASAWASHQYVVGTPSIFIDDGYYNADSSESSISDGVEAAGSRSGTTGFGVIQGDTFKRAELEVYYLPSETEFRVRAVVRYIESEGGPPGPRGNVRLNGFLNIFMVEDMIDAYSSDIDENVTCHNAFRGFAKMKEPVVLDEGGEWSGEFTWKIPELDIDDNQLPIDPSNLFPVAVLYDSDDTSSGGLNGWPGATRSMNSATPKSTAYDIKASPMDISDVVAIVGDETTIVSVDFGDEEVSGAVIVYNTISTDHNGTWRFAELSESGDGKWTAEIRHTGKIYYSLRVYDENWVETRTDISEMRTFDLAAECSSCGIGWVIPILALLAVAGAAVYIFKPELLNTVLPGKKSRGGGGVEDSAGGGAWSSDSNIHAPAPSDPDRTVEEEDTAENEEAKQV